MNKEEYIKQCGSRTSKDLSADQILTYFINGHGGVRNRMSAMMIKAGRMFGCSIDRAKGVAMLRQAFDKDKVLNVQYVEGEGIVTDGQSIGGGYFSMEFEK